MPWDSEIRSSPQLGGFFSIQEYPVNYLQTMGVAFAFMLLISACGNKPESADDYLRSGVTYYEQQDLDRARVQLRNALRQDADLAEAYYYLGKIAKQRSDHAGVGYFMSRVVGLAPEHVSAHQELAEVSILSGDLPRARQSRDRLLELAPEQEKTQQIILALLVADRNWDDAATHAQGALQDYPESPELWGLSGLVHKHLGDTAAALAAFDRAIGLSAEQMDAQYRLLRYEVNQQAGDIDGMIMDLKSLVTSTDDPARYVLHLVEVVAQEQGEDRAQALLQSYIERFPQAALLQIAHIEQLRATDPSAAGQALQEYIANADNPVNLLFYRVSVGLEHAHYELVKADLGAIIQASDGNQYARQQAKTLLAEVLLAEGDLAASKELVDAVLAQEVNHHRALIVRARLAFAEGENRLAVEHLNRVLSQNLHAGDALELLGSYYAQQGNARLAEEIYDRLLEQQPRHKQALIFKISRALDRGFLNSADALLERALVGRVHDLQLLSLKVQVAALRGQWQQAESALQVVRDSGLDAAQSFYLEGFIRRRQQKFAEAVTLFAQAIEAQGVYDGALSLMRESAQAAGDSEGFGEFLQKQLQRQPQDARARLYLAQQRAQKDARGAAQLLSEGLALDPGWADGHIALTELHQAEGNTDSAIDHAQSAYRDIEDPRLGNTLASLLVLKQKYAEAEAVYQNILERSPDLPIVRNNYAALLSNQLYSQANARKAVALSEIFAQSNNPVFLDTYGFALHRAGRHPEAIRVLQRALQERDIPAIRYHFALALKADGRSAQALSVLERAKAQQVDDSVLNEQISQLYNTLAKE